MIKKISTIMILGLLSIFLIPATSAALNLQCSPSGSAVCKEVKDGGTKLPTLAKSITNVLFFIVGVVAVIMIIVSGIRYITANGDANKVQAAKNTLMYSVVGLIVALLAFAIVNFVVSSL